jgi:hypothetical protein
MNMLIFEKKQITDKCIGERESPKPRPPPIRPPMPLPKPLPAPKSEPCLHATKNRINIKHKKSKNASVLTKRKAF